MVSLRTPTAWTMDGTIFVRGRPFGRELVDFKVEAVEGGSSLTAVFRFEGRGPLNAFLLWALRRSLRTGREKAYRTYANCINEEYRRKHGTA